MHANHREEIEPVYAGDIAAAVGLKDTYTGDTLSDPDHPVILESITFPEPVIEVTIEPKTKADQDKLGIALQRLSEEDPTFRVKTDQETGQTLIAGMGELHLEVIVDRMIREFRVDANIGRPQVAYRETIRRAARRATAASCARPAARASTAMPSSSSSRRRRARATSSIDKIVGGSIPREYIKPVDAGHPRGAGDGHLRRLPGRGRQGDAVRRLVPRGRLVRDGVQDRRFDGRQGRVPARRTRQILEPIMRVEVTMPEEFMGDVIGDLNSRRGHIEGMETRGNDAGRPGVRAAGGDVRLRHRPAVDDPGPRDAPRWSSRTTPRSRPRSRTSSSRSRKV